MKKEMKKETKKSGIGVAKIATPVRLIGTPNF